MEIAPNKKIYFENLDGLRFFGFLFVFVSHLVLFSGFHNESELYANLQRFILLHGNLGVIFFFVLSGFLITYLLFQEKKKGDINLKNFYMRRILRIWPLYFLIIAIAFFVVPLISPLVGGDFPYATGWDLAKFPWYFFFAGNIAMAFSPAPSIMVAILWAVAMEEQFYLFWPLAVKYFSRYKLLILIGGLTLLSFLFRMTHVSSEGWSEYFPISTMAPILVGAGLAYAVEYMPNIKERFANMSKASIALLYASILALMPFKGMLRALFQNDSWYRFMYPFVLIVFSFLFALVIAEQNYSKNSLFKIGRHKALTKLGAISYGLYAYHLVALFLVQTFIKSIGLHTKHTNVWLFLAISILTAIVTLLLSHLSYHYFEKRFLKLKEKFRG